MTRDQAVGLLVDVDIERLGADRRRRRIESWWYINEEDEEYDGLPDSLKEEIRSSDGPVDPMLMSYLPLLRLSVRESYVGALNAYIERRLGEIGLSGPVEGPVEVLRACECCRYCTLKNESYDVCPVCFWEDVGAVDLDRVSGPNHMTLREARMNFETIGAITQGALAFVMPDGKCRYARAEGGSVSL